MKPDIVLFDALNNDHLRTIGRLLANLAGSKCPLFSVGSSGVEAALAAQWNSNVSRPASASTSRAPGGRRLTSAAAGQILIGSGSCSPVTMGQIAWALKHGFAEVPLNTTALASGQGAADEIRRASTTAARRLAAGRSVIIHTTKCGANNRVAARLGRRTAEVLGRALGNALRHAVATHPARLCIAGGDTSSYAARALGIEAVEMIAPLTPGAPLCRATASGSPTDGLQVVFKGGQVGAEDYFETAKHGGKP